MYVVALYTFGSFHGWATDPLSREDAAEFVLNPPPRVGTTITGRLVIFSLDREDDDTP